MNARADFALEKPDGTPTLQVEVKGRRPTSTEWARQYRRNLAAHAVLSPASYFLLASPDKFFLWRPDLVNLDADPDYVIDAKDLLEPYFERLGKNSTTLSGAGLELLVSNWLSEILNNPDPNLAPLWLRDSGLLNALLGTRLRQEWNG